MKPAHVLLLTQEDQTIAAIRSALESRPLAEAANVCGTIMDLRTELARTTNGHLSIALVDIDQDPERLLSELSRITMTYPHLRLIVLSQEFSERRVLHAMQAGARHFLRKNAIAAELDPVLEHLLAQRPEAPTASGQILSIFPCSGGCGATTVAINLANELRLALAQRVLIVDLDTHYGAAASYLGLKGRYGIGHVLGRPDSIDRHLIESTAATYCTDFDVLLSPAAAEADRGVSLNYDSLPATLEACRESYDTILVDAPRAPREIMMELASISRINLIVLQLTVRDVGFAGSLISFLTDQGIPRERILALANRVRRRGPLLRIEDGQRAIGAHTLHPIRSDWARAVRSVNRGQPLADVANRCRLRRDYQRLAAMVQQCMSNGSS